MKKIIAMLAALTMSAAMFTACGDIDSSGDTKSSADKSAAESAEAADETESTAEAAESADETESTDDAVGEDDNKGGDDNEGNKSEGELGPLGKAYNDKVSAGNVQMEAKIDMMGDQPVIMEKNGDNIHMKMSLFGMNLDIYQVDGKCYNLIPASEMYIIIPEEQAAMYTENDYADGIADGSVFVESYEEDGFTVEKYTVKEEMVVSLAEGVSMDMEDTAQESTVLYYFDSDGNLKKIVTQGMMDTTVEFTKLAFEDVPVEMPDLSGWEEVTQDSITPVNQVKLTAGMMGITKEMIEAAGYTYEQIAEMDEDKQQEVIEKIAADNGITIGGGLF